MAVRRHECRRSLMMLRCADIDADVSLMSFRRRFRFSLSLSPAAADYATLSLFIFFAY